MVTRAVLMNQYLVLATRRTCGERSWNDLQSGEFARYFPEYGELPIVPAFSSLNIPDDTVTYLTRRGVFAQAMVDEALPACRAGSRRHAERSGCALQRTRRIRSQDRLAPLTPPRRSR